MNKVKRIIPQEDLEVSNKDILKAEKLIKDLVKDTKKDFKTIVKENKLDEKVSDISKTIIKDGLNFIKTIKNDWEEYTDYKKGKK